MIVFSECTNKRFYCQRIIATKLELSELEYVGIRLRLGHKSDRHISENVIIVLYCDSVP